MFLYVQLLLFVINFQVEAQYSVFLQQNLFFTPQKLTKKLRYCGQNQRHVRTHSPW